MHGHAIRVLAVEEHIDMWTDFTAGAVYGALKRLEADELITAIRTEREGNYPERQVYDITDAGRASLRDLRREGLEQIVLRPDPFDLVITRLDPESLGELGPAVAARLAEVRARLEEHDAHATRIDQYLRPAERIGFEHHAERLRAEIRWHERLLAIVPDIIADETRRSEGHTP